jgi:crotonobetainyl-CoA:carnitine CoA-transferase CaiB-like acyl-CoA transferase
MLDTMVAYLWPEGMAGFTFIGKEVKAARAQFAQDLIFQTTDGYITAGAVSDAEWEGMCLALEREEWIQDERFNTPNGRILNVAERLELTAEVLLTRSSAEWLSRLDAHGVPCAPVLERHEVFEHEQVRLNEMVSEYDHPVAGRIRQPRPAARFDKTPAAINRHAPVLGEHTAELLAELDLDVDELVAQRVVRAGGSA